MFDANPLLYIHRPLLFFKFLRNFGHLTRNLRVCFDELNDQLCVQMENYLAKYCADSLQRFSLRCKWARCHFEDLQTPFKNVIALKIQTSMDEQTDHIQFITEKNFPNLQELRFSGSYYLSRSENFHLKNIESFSMFGNIHDTFPFIFENLKHLSVGCLSITENFCEFVSKMRYLETISVMDVWWSNEQNMLPKMLALENVQSHVVEMTIQFKSIDDSTDDLFHFIKRSQKLRKLSLFLSSLYYSSKRRNMYTQAMKTIVSELGGNWTCKIINPCLNPFETQRQIKNVCVHLESVM